MPPIVMAAVFSILAAAVPYAVAVFAERRAGILKGWHLALPLATAKAASGRS